MIKKQTKTTAGWAIYGASQSCFKTEAQMHYYKTCHKNSAFCAKRGFGMQ